MEAYLITTEGKKTKLPKDPLKGHGLDALQDLRKLIGPDCGIVERVTFPWGEMWADENGLLTGLPINEEATRIFNKQFPMMPQAIVGNVVCRVRKGRSLP